MKHCKSVGFGQ